MSDVANRNSKIGQSADRASAGSQGTSDSPVGAAISSAGTAMGAYGTVMSATGHLSEAAVVPVLKKLSFMQGIACLPASAHLDPVLGIDVHFVIIPPSPAPIPMPHPFIAIMLDPRDWISIAVMSVAAMAAPVPTDGGDGDAAASLAFSAATMVLALLGMGATVKVGSFQPRTVTGVSNTVIPHFPMGASFAPVPVLKNSGHAQFGSLFLSADGNPFSGLLHLNNDCWDIGIMQLMRRQYKTEPMHLFLPTGFIMAIPAHNVIINPIPTPINPITALTSLFNFGIAKLLHGLTKRLPISSRLSSMLNKSICHVTGHPVDVASGVLFTDEEDFNLPGMVPLSWDRTWYSDSVYKGPLGHGWHHGYDMGFFIDEMGQGIVRLKDGRLAGFDLPLPGRSSYNRYEQLTLHCHPEEKFYYLTDAEGLIYRFTDKKYGERGECFLQSVANANGYAIRLEYDRRGCLIQIVDSAARILTVENDREGRIIRILAPHPEQERSTIAVASYAYDEDGNLTEQVDALGQTMSYMYEGRLLKQEVWRNGQRWYFIYDGKETGARCIHTWGDGGLYDHQLTYLEGRTLVENSLGYITTYQIKDGLPESRTDPSGAVWEYRYNRWHELEWTTDPLGNQQGYTHDEKGNIATTTDAGGGFTYREFYDPRWPHLPTEGMDAAGGKWKWLYDKQGNLLEEVDPLGAATEYEYNDGLLSVIERGGAKTLLEYDGQRNLVSVRKGDGGITSYSYDRLGNCLKAVNPNGRTQRCQYDWKGRVVRMEDFDGNVTECEYDGLDNMVRRRDRHRDIRYTYQGLWNMTSRTEAGSTIHFSYDTEERLRKVVNEQGQTYLFQLDSNGRVVRDIGFDGMTRRYERNAAGWVTTMHKPKEKFARYGYDACGRCIRVDYTDGSFEEYAFRPDGEMVKAVNETASVEFRLDVGGNVLSESSGSHWVRSEYDRMGQRVRTTSSLGAAIDRSYDALGDMRRLGGGGWSASIDYDQLGLEVSRQLPGGIQRQWQRDGVGRPVALRVGSGKTRNYAWDVNSRLQQIRDGQGLTRLIHDARGRLSETIFPEGEVQLRNPDAIGNLFRSGDRKDRVFGKGGRLKKAGGWEYVYDEEGRLITKEHADGKVWSYIWNEAGRLVGVTRPDGNMVSFGYDALGRRMWKKYHNTITNFIWDGERLLHEWKEGKDVITWLFDEQSFSPAAKLKGDKQYSIVTDHLGVPLQMYREDGQLFWEGELDSYGGIRMEKGEMGSCPFRYPGQYADAETGLYYNLNRYYAPEEGCYIQQDPIGLHSGELNLYAYVGDPTVWMDELGLDKSNYNGNRGEARAEHDIKRNGFKKVRSQVAMTVNGHSIKADFVAEDGHGNLHVFESKFGSGRLTKNQKATGMFNTRNPANTCRKGGGTILTGNGRAGSFVENGSAPKPATFHVLKYR